MSQALKEQNGLVLAMLYAGFFPFPIAGGYSIGLHVDLRTPQQSRRYRLLQEGLEQSIAYKNGFPDPVTPMVWGAHALGLQPVDDAPSGAPSAVPGGRTVGDLQRTIRGIAQEHMGGAMELDPPMFFAAMTTLLVEAIGGIAQAGRLHPAISGHLPGFQAGQGADQTAKMIDRAANAVFIIAILADRCGADLQAIAEALPGVVESRLRKE